MPKPHQLWKKCLFTANTLCAVTVNFSLKFVCLCKTDGLVVVTTPWHIFASTLDLVREIQWSSSVLSVYLLFLGNLIHESREGTTYNIRLYSRNRYKASILAFLYLQKWSTQALISLWSMTDFLVAKVLHQVTGSQFLCSRDSTQISYF